MLSGARKNLNTLGLVAHFDFHTHQTENEEVKRFDFLVWQHSFV